MNRCVYQTKWNGDPCDRRSECLNSCRAGWLPEPIRCERCGVLTMGPFTATILDDGDDQVIFRLACLRCAPLLDAIDTAEVSGYAAADRLLRDVEGRC